MKGSEQGLLDFIHFLNNHKDYEKKLNELIKQKKETLAAVQYADARTQEIHEEEIGLEELTKTIKPRISKLNEREIDLKKALQLVVEEKEKLEVVKKELDEREHVFNDKVGAIQKKERALIVFKISLDLIEEKLTKKSKTLGVKEAKIKEYIKTLG